MVRCPSTRPQGPLHSYLVRRRRDGRVKFPVSRSDSVMAGFAGTASDNEVERDRRGKKEKKTKKKQEKR